MKPRIFIGSSSENIWVAKAIQINLQNDGFSPTIWDQDIFKLTKTIIESLIQALPKYDYAVFVFRPDDVTKLRDENVNTVRDNVLLELGLFMGSLGRESCFFVVPQNQKNLHLPTNLLGVMAAEYDSTREDVVPALGAACSQISLAIKDQMAQTNTTGLVGIPCAADICIKDWRGENEGILIQRARSSDLFFLLLSVRHCETSRIHIDKIPSTKEFEEIQIEAMYDLMGSWDLLIKFRAQSNSDLFRDKVLDTLYEKNMMKQDQSHIFGRRELIKVLSQSPTVEGLLEPNRDEGISHTLLNNGKDYDKYRASRAFLFMGATGEKMMVID